VIAILTYVIFCTPVTPVAPTMVTNYADVDVRYAGGEVTILKVRPGRYAKPTPLRRFRGRFTAIAAKGKSSLAEVSFDFPLLAEAESDDATEESHELAEKLRKGVTSTTTVRVPLAPDADSVIVYDAMTQKTVKAPLNSTATAPEETKAKPGAAAASPPRP
jgi:hypothetical protein